MKKNKIIILIIVVLFILEVSSVFATIFGFGSAEYEEMTENVRNYIGKTSITKDKIESESTLLAELPTGHGYTLSFAGKEFCTDTGQVILSAKGYWEVTASFYAATTTTPNLRTFNHGYLEIRRKDDEGEWSIQIDEPMPIFTKTLAPIGWDGKETKTISTGKIPIPKNLNLRANDLSTCTINSAGPNKPENYAAGVTAYTEIPTPASGYRSVPPPKINAKTIITLEENINLAQIGCGLIDENTPSTSQICGKKGCSVILSASYIELNIPENALEEEASFINGISGEIITIYKFENNEQPGLVSPLYYITPEDLTLNLPATLTLEYEENLINNEDDISLARLDGRNLIKLETISIDKENNRITAKTDNLGYFVVAEDKIPPKIEISTNPEELWPPNNKPVDVAIYGSVIDDISGVNKNSLKLTINNEEKEFSIDDFGNFNFVIPLIAKRSGQEKQGYEYKIELSAEDNFGNAAASSSIVLVPHDQRK